jgi:cobalt-zinc-cadmium efflux system protein
LAEPRRADDDGGALASAPHGAHAHFPTGADAERRIAAAVLLTGGFMLAEVIGGLFAGSLALLADAGHMLTDVMALVLAYGGIRIGRRPADPARSFGYARLEVLAAFLNGIVLIALSIWIVIEAVTRLFEPREILGGLMLAVAIVGLLVNVASFAILRGAQASINVAGALVHVIGDTLGSVAAIAAASVIFATGWTPIDPILSVFVAALIIGSGWAVVRRAGHILLEGTPEGMDPAEIGREVARLPGIAEAFHVHVWSLTSGRPLATLLVRLEPGTSSRDALLAIRSLLVQRYGIAHSTVEIEPR